VPDGGGAAPTLLEYLRSRGVAFITPASWDEEGWQRAYDSGYAEGLQAARTAVVFIERAGRRLSKVPEHLRKAIWDEAIDEVMHEHGDLPVVITRSLAARRITALYSRAALRRLVEP
jgi:hypothetical protein